MRYNLHTTHSTPLKCYYCRLKKKKHNLKVESYVSFCRLSEDFKPGRQPLRIALRDCLEEAREEPRYIGTLRQKTRWPDIKSLLLIKENCTFQVKELSACLRVGRCGVWAHWSRSCDLRFQLLRPLPRAFPSWVPSGLTVRAGVVAGWP